MLSAKYRAIDTQVYLDRIEQQLTNLGITFEKRSYHVGRRGSKQRITYTLTNKETRLFGDVIRPQIILANSNDGSMAFTVMMGMYRLVCTNGLVIGDGWYHERIVHVQGPTIERKLKELDYQIAAFMPQFEEFVAKMHSRLGKQVTKEQQLTIIDSLNLPVTVAESAKSQVLAPRRIEDTHNTLWTLWNTINEANRFSSRTANGAFSRDQRLLDRLLLAA